MVLVALEKSNRGQEVFSVLATLFRVYALDRTEKRFLDLSISNEGGQKSLEFL